MNEHNLFYGKNNNPFLIQISKTCSGFYKSPNYLKSEKQFKKLSRIKEKIFPRKKLLTSLENELNLFHHSILARKIATNPPYIQMKNRTCHTDRGYTIKPRISQNFFLTKINNSQNSSDIIENNSNKKPHKAIFYKGLTKNNDNNINLLIPAQCFIKFDLKKYQFLFNPNSKIIGFYVNTDNIKKDSSGSLTTFITVIIIVVVIIIAISLVVCKILTDKYKRKKKANELTDDDFDYTQKEENPNNLGIS